MEKNEHITTWDEAGRAIENYHIQLEIGDAIGTGYCWVASLPPIIDCEMPYASGKTPFEAIENLLILLGEKK